MENNKAKLVEINSKNSTKASFNNRSLSILILSALILVVVGSIVAISTLIGQNYAKRIQLENQKVREIVSQRAEFAVKKIILKKNGYVYEISDTGLVVSYLESTSNILNNRRIISNTRLSNLLKNLTEEEFLNLLAGYFTSGDAYTLTIETTNGSKTIVFNDQYSTPPPDEIGNILDEANEIIEELNNPQPTPPLITPTPNPTTTPQPSTTPYPTFTPTPPPGGPSPSTQPFTCDMLQNQINDVTVSNTVCIPDN